jgi:hypothetical protein
MATLMSSATLLPLKGIDVLEFALDDLAHFLRVIRGNASREICERRLAFLDRHSEHDFAAFGESLGPFEWAKHAVLEHGLESFFHRDDRSSVSTHWLRGTDRSPPVQPTWT